jgi:hypothetical protein
VEAVIRRDGGGDDSEIEEITPPWKKTQNRKKTTPVNTQGVRPTNEAGSSSLRKNVKEKAKRKRKSESEEEEEEDDFEDDSEDESE